MIQINKILLPALVISVLTVGLGTHAFENNAFALTSQDNTSVNSDLKGKIKSINRINDAGLTKVVIKVTTDKNVENVKMTITTDKGSKKLYLDELRTHKSNLINALVTFKDPAFIKVHFDKAFPYEKNHLRAINQVKFL